MAAKLEDVTNDLEELVTCGICNDIFNTPKTLRCLHTFCLQCLEGWYKQCKTDEKPFKCPSCRTPIQVQADDVSKLPTSFQHNSLTGFYNTLKERKTGDQQQLLPCFSCSNHRVVVGFCFHCGGMLCNECYNSHKNVKALKETHQATLWSEFNKNTISSFIDYKSLCQKKYHEKYHLEYYCEECKKTLCHQCLVTPEHKDHKKVSLEEASERAQQRLRREKIRLHEVAELHGNEQRLCRENRERIWNKVHAMDTQLLDDLQAINNIMQEKVQTHRAMLQKYLEQQTKDNDEEKSVIDDHLEQACGLRDQCEKIENMNLKQFILEEHEKLEEVCQANVKGTPILPRRPLKRYSSARYVPYKETLQILQDLELGEIDISETDPSHCTIESVFQSRIGTVNDFNIITRDAEWNECYTDEALLDIQIQDADGNPQVDKEITQSQPGRILVKYEAQNLSPYKIQVSIGGTLVSNSPQVAETFDAEAECRPIKVLPIPNVIGAMALAVSDCGLIAVVEARVLMFSSKVLLYDANGKLLTEVGGEGTTRETRIYDARGVAFSDDDEILVSDDHDKHGFIKQFGTDGDYKKSIIKQKGMEFKRMCTTDQGIACLARDKKNKETLIMLFRKETCDHLQDIKLDINHNEMPRYLSYYNNKYFVTFHSYVNIYVFDEDGSLLNIFGQAGSSEGQFREPRGLAMFRTDKLLVCDMVNHRVQMFNHEGEFITSFGSRGSGLGQMEGPTDVAATADGRQVLVLDSNNQRLQVFR